MQQLKKRFSSVLAVLVIAAILIGAGRMILLTLPYTAFKPHIDFLKTKVFVYHIRYWRVSFYVHVFTATFALLAGLTQFSGYIIRHWPKLHRVAGYIYVSNILAVTGPAALVMSFYANGGWAAKISFILQSLGWLISTGIALQRALTKQFLLHGNWMLRSYALTLAALTLRMYAALLSVSGSDMRPLDKYILISWASWIPNLIVAELLIRTGFIKRLMAGKAFNNTHNV